MQTFTELFFFSWGKDPSDLTCLKLCSDLPKVRDLSVNSDIYYQILPRSNVSILGETSETEKTHQLNKNTLVVTHSCLRFKLTQFYFHIKHR